MELKMHIFTFYNKLSHFVNDRFSNEVPRPPQIPTAVLESGMAATEIFIDPDGKLVMMGLSFVDAYLEQLNAYCDFINKDYGIKLCYKYLVEDAGTKTNLNMIDFVAQLESHVKWILRDRPWDIERVLGNLPKLEPNLITDPNFYREVIINYDGNVRYRPSDEPHSSEVNAFLRRLNKFRTHAKKYAKINVDFIDVITFRFGPSVFLTVTYARDGKIMKKRIMLNDACLDYRSRVLNDGGEKQDVIKLFLYILGFDNIDVKQIKNLHIHTILNSAIYDNGSVIFQWEDTSNHHHNLTLGYSTVIEFK